MRPSSLLFVAFALAASCTRHLSLQQFDGMLRRDLGTRCILRGEGFTLWSPQDWTTSKDWYLLLAEELPAALHALGLEAAGAPHVQVLLREVEGMQPFELAASGGGITYTAADQPHPLHGVAGWAAEDEIVVPIAPARVLVLEDGREITSVMSADHYRAVVRHELAHILLGGRGLPGADWFSEGAADVIEGLHLCDGVLVDRGAPRRELELARQMGCLARPLVELLEWREDGWAVSQGREEIDAPSRVLCGLYVRWSLGLAGNGAAPVDLLARLESLARRSRAEHLAGAGRWHAWLADQTSGPEADAGIPAAPDYTLAPSNRRPAPPEPTTGTPR